MKEREQSTLSLDRINIGCGMSPTKGWRNLDNSLSLWLAKHGFLFKILDLLNLLSREQKQYIRFCRSAGIELADATKSILAASNSIGVVYASHMVEHLSRRQVETFLIEVRRILRNGGILRLVVPDFDYFVRQYDRDHDVDKFLNNSLLVAPSLNCFRQRLRLLVSGYRHHQWMYTKDSIALLLKGNGFEKVKILKPGQTMIINPMGLNLFERAENSIFVEGIKTK